MKSGRKTRATNVALSILVIAVIFSIFGLAGCGGGGSNGSGGVSGGGGGFATTAGATLTGLQVTPGTAMLAVGEKLKLSMTGVYSDNSHQDVSSICQCVSSAPDIVSFDDNTDIASALKPGTATITSKDPTTGISGTATITVTNATLSSIQISPTNPTIAVGGTTSFVVTGIYSDNSTYVMTPYVTFTSSAADVATIDKNGVATALKQGQTTITATDPTSSKSASTLLNVGGTGTGPSVVSVSPATLKAGDDCTITGSGFGTRDGKSANKDTGTVYFGSAPATEYTSWTDTKIVCKVPAGVTAGAIVITVHTAAGATSPSSSGSQATVTSSGSGGGGGGGGGGGVTPSDVRALTITSNNTMIGMNMMTQLNAMATLQNGTVMNMTSQVTWMSNNTSVAWINNSSGMEGQLSTAMTEGTCVITATVPNTRPPVTASMTFTVVESNVKAITITPPNPQLTVGITQQLIATEVYNNGTKESVAEEMTWQSLNPAVATVSNAPGTKGLVTPLFHGSADIVAAHPGLDTPVYTKVTVLGKSLTQIQVTPQLQTISSGEQIQFTATALFDDATIQDVTSQVAWTSSKPAAATIGVNGTATAAANIQAPDSTVITATLQGFSGTSTLNVTNAPLRAIEISPPTATITTLMKQQYSAKGFYDDGNMRDLTQYVTWQVATGTSATISNAPGTVGLCTAGATAGQCTITASMSGVTSAAANLNVTDAMLVSLAITHPTVQVVKGIPQQFTATGTYNNNTTQDLTAQVSWVSSNQATAIISNLAGSNGLLTPLASGTTDISAMFPGSAVAATTTVSVLNGTLTSITLAPASATLALGTSTRIKATGNYSGPGVPFTMDITNAVTWTTSSPAVAMVDNSMMPGMIMPMSAGAATITASLPGGGAAGVATAAITVSGNTLSALAITPVNPSIPAGMTQQYTATGTFSGADPAFNMDLTTFVKWASNAPVIAVISNTSGSQGLAYGLQQGVVPNITATFPLAPLVVGQQTLTVNAATLMSITVQPSNDATYPYRIPTVTPDPITGLPIPMTYQFTAWGMYSDGTMQDITGLVNWTSSNLLAMTMSATNMGLGTSVANGLTTITATDPLLPISGTTQVKIVTQLDGATFATKFVDPLPNPPLMPQDPANPNHYTVDVQETTCQMLPAPYGATTIWAYGSPAFGVPCQFPGPTFLAMQGTPNIVTWNNSLPAGHHILPIDYSLMGADIMQPPNRYVTHLHGAWVASQYDGDPEQWFSTGLAQKGPWFTTNVYTYENLQEPCTLWYHDHTIGLTHLNPYGGLAGFYILTNAAEMSLPLPGTWTNDSLDYLLGICLQDKFFYDDGSLAYPNTMINGVQSSVQPETFGDFAVINGKCWPYKNVEPRKYQLRFLNGSNARFYHFSIMNGATPLPMQLIGTEQGLMDAPYTTTNLLIAPGERMNVVVDFSGLAVGTTLTMTNDAPTPYDPAGAIANPLPPTDPLAQLMQFKVVAAGPTSKPDPGPVPNPLRVAGGAVAPIVPPSPASAVQTRMLFLKEYMDMMTGRMKPTLCGKGFMEPVTETPKLNTTEIWSVTNWTPDTHPIHLHLVKFLKLDSTPFDNTVPFDPLNPTTVTYTGPAVGPNPDDTGWKDTLKMDPGTVTRIIAKFDGYSGRYVWHCHILEHEEFDMMRYMDVLP